ncbi:XdhC family protein [Streptomyces sp. NPDC048489]|uniref:XdhC family protein n=1 Tax=Streptomyces sp. NPDC048489 TaxID=3154504 RepID=UPI003412E636
MTRPDRDAGRGARGGPGRGSTSARTARRASGVGACDPRRAVAARHRIPGIPSRGRPRRAVTPPPRSRCQYARSRHGAASPGCLTPRRTTPIRTARSASRASTRSGPAAFIGAMGSRRTHEDRERRLREAGLTGRELSRLRSPIGLDLGARTPDETALSIAAEIVAAREGGTGTPLTGSRTPIHRDGGGGPSDRAPGAREAA